MALATSMTAERPTAERPKEKDQWDEGFRYGKERGAMEAREEKTEREIFHHLHWLRENIENEIHRQKKDHHHTSSELFGLLYHIIQARKTYAEILNKKSGVRRR